MGFVSCHDVPRVPWAFGPGTEVATAVRELNMSFRSIRNSRALLPFRATESAAVDGAPVGDAIVVVSGLPRSGTSMMMQMLAAAGIEPLTDGTRVPDRDNPKGYFEWEPIKQISKDHRILRRKDVHGKAIKVISTLLPELPKAYQYKVLFIQRDIREIVTSQTLMLSANNKPEASQDRREMERKLAAHNDKIISWAKDAPHLDVLILSHREMIRKPDPQIADIVAFLGPGVVQRPEAMAGEIDGSLYRNRNAGLLADFKDFFRS